MAWGSEIADILVQTSGLLEALPEQRWEEPSLCERWRVRDVVGHLVWRLGTDTSAMATQVMHLMREARIGPVWAIDTLSVQAAQAPREELVASLRRVARDKLAGRGRAGISELSEALVHSYDITSPLGIPIEVEPHVSKAVARGRTKLVPTACAQVLRERRLRAVDAGWSVGRGGRSIDGTAQGVVLYLFGRTPLPAPAR